MSGALSTSSSGEPAVLKAKRRSLRALEATNFFLADVQTGVGPFISAYLAAEGWKADRVGTALTVAGVVTVLLQTPAGGLIDRIRAKRAIVIVGTLVLATGALLLSFNTTPWAVYSAQVLIGASGPFLGPTLAALTMGLVGIKLFDRQFGRNQSFNAAGNIACAALIAAVSHSFGNRSIFITAALVTVPTILCVLAIRRKDIDAELARGGCERAGSSGAAKAVVSLLLRDRVLAIFLLCSFLFHLGNAAMLPQLGELLAHGSVRTAAPFMSACIVVTQVIIMLSAAGIGRMANRVGRKPLLLIGFGVLPIRGVLYTLVHASGALIAVQVLDGVANAIFGVVSILVIADRTQGTGRFNLVQGVLATAVGLGAALSTTVGGKLMMLYGYRISFLSLGAIAATAFLLVLTTVPETGPRGTLSIK